MTPFEITAYRPELKDQVVELYAAGFLLKPPVARRYLEWKYEENPYLDEPLMFLALDRRGSVVGMRGFYGTCWKRAGQRVVLPCADDFLIAEGARNSGLATTIMRSALSELARRGFQYVLNASGGPVTVLQSLAMGWGSLGAMEPVARLSRRERARQFLRQSMQGKPFLWRFVGDSTRHDPAVLRRFDHASRRAGSRGVVVAAGTSARPEPMAAVADGRPDDGHVAHVRDPGYFRWRFRNPTRDYRFVYAERDGGLEGFLAVAAYPRVDNPYQPFNIVDWEARDEAVAAELLRAALDWGRFPALGAWAASHTTQQRVLLEEHGFRPSNLERRARGMPCVLLKTLQQEGALAATLVDAKWRIRLVDSMVG